MPPGLREELELDISHALSDVDKLDAALHQTAQGFKRELAQAAEVLRGGGGKFTARVDVVGEGDLKEARRDADRLDDSVRQVDKSTDSLRGRFGELKTAAAAVGGALVVREVFQELSKAVDAASDLAESTSKVTVVFGDSADVITDWSKDSAQSLGLANQTALEFAGTFGNLFTALGLAREEAAELSPEVVQLGADLASFNNLEVDETLEKLRSGLVGEIEPLRSLGVSFNALQVEQKALSLGLQDANGVISEGAKVQARWALIVEQSAAASGDFARTSGGLANQQRILSAEVGNLRAEIGVALLPVVLEMVTQFREALPSIRDLADGAVPVLTGSIRVLVPVGLSLLDLLVALSPVIELVADVIEALPAPILQGAAALGIFGTGLGPLPNLFSQFATGAKSATGVVPSLTAGLRGLNPWVVGLSVVLPVLTGALGDHRKEQRENAQAVKDTAASYADLSKSVDESNASIAEARIRDSGQVDDLERLGISYEDFARRAETGAEAQAKFLQQLVDSGEIRIDKRITGDDVIDDVASALEHFGTVQAAVNAGAIRGNDELVQSMIDLGEQYQAAAQLQLDDLVVREKLTRENVKASEKQHKLADGTIDYVGVLRELRPASDAARKSTADIASEMDASTESFEEMEDRIRDTISALEDFFDEQRTGLSIESDFKAAIDDLVGGFKDNGRTLDINTEKGRDNLDNILQTREALLAVAAQRFEETHSIDEATKAVGEHRDELHRELVAAGLSEEAIASYMDTLGLTPEEVRTRLIVEDAKARGTVVGFVQYMSVVGEQAAAAFAAGIVDGFRNEEGTIVGSADSIAHVIQTTVEKRLGIASPSRVGMEIGGLFVEGLSLGIERDAELARQAAQDVGGDMAAALMRGAFVTDDEMLGILDALDGVKKAEEALAEARSGGRGSASEVLAGEKALQDARESLWDLTESGTATELDLAVARQGVRDAEAELNRLRHGGAVSAEELRRAELELAAAQSQLNDVVFEARDATAEMTAEWDRMNEALNGGVSALTALRGLRDARETVADLREEASAAADALDAFDSKIAETAAQLALVQSQRAATGGDPTVEERRLVATLEDLQRRRAGAAETAEDAQTALSDALLDQVLATQQLVDTAAQAGPALGQWEEFMRGLGTAAGLSQEEVDGLVSSLEQASYLAVQTRNSLFAGTPIVVPTATAAPTSGSATVGRAGVTIEELNIYEARDGRSTAREVIGELRTEQVLAGV